MDKYLVVKALELAAKDWRSKLGVVGINGENAAFDAMQRFWAAAYDNGVTADELNKVIYTQEELEMLNVLYNTDADRVEALADEFVSRGLPRSAAQEIVDLVFDQS